MIHTPDQILTYLSDRARALGVTGEASDE